MQTQTRLISCLVRSFRLSHEFSPLFRLVIVVLYVHLYCLYSYKTIEKLYGCPNWCLNVLVDISLVIYGCPNCSKCLFLMQNLANANFPLVIEEIGSHKQMVGVVVDWTWVDGMGLLMGLVKKQKKNQMGKVKCFFFWGGWRGKGRWGLRRVVGFPLCINDVLTELTTCNFRCFVHNQDENVFPTIYSCFLFWYSLPSPKFLLWFRITMFL